MPQVRGKGLFARLNAKGKKCYSLKFLSAPLIWLEEVSRSDSAVLRSLMTLLHGRKVVNVENIELEIKALPILEMNVKKGT